MEDLAFRLPRKVFKYLLVGALLVAILWGIFTQDSQKAWSLWEWQVTAITTPIFNFFKERIENRMEAVTGAAFEHYEAEQ